MRVFEKRRKKKKLAKSDTDIGYGDVPHKALLKNDLMTFGINVHTHPYCACVFLPGSKTISAIVFFFRTNCNSYSGPTVHFDK